MYQGDKEAKVKVCREIQMAKIKQRALYGFILNAFRTKPTKIVLHGNELCVHTRANQTIHLGILKEPPKVRNGMLGSSVSITSDVGTKYILRGARKSGVLKFSNAVLQQWIKFNLERLQSNHLAIEHILQVINDLEASKVYPSACLISPALEQARQLNADIFSKLLPDSISKKTRTQIEKIRYFITNLESIRNQAIRDYETKQLTNWAQFFENFESNPLTYEQRKSIITDEDATLVLAGAGSGKTSVITAKAGYLLRSGVRKPEEILLLAFAKDAANEMSERIEAKCGVALEARTFHSLAYEIIGVVEGSKPALAAHATDEKAYLALIGEILRTLVQTSSSVSDAILRWFSYARFEDKSEWDFQTAHSYYTYIEKMDLRTLQGEQVKSFEELMIANWLFENGIEYDYEPDYEHKVSTNGMRDYCPDFRLKKSGVYIEHFGVRKKKVGSEWQLTTAPFVDRDKYLQSMEWKKNVHKKYETSLIETFSFEKADGSLLSSLKNKVAPFEELSPRSPETIFDRIIELNQADSFAQLMGTFLRHYKGGGYELGECTAKSKNLNLGQRAEAFLSIFEPVYEEYQKLLGGRIDFEDMILRATGYVETEKYKSPFKHILVDEFQDISRSRGGLVKAIKSQHKEARVFAVGDDWQSIYRFTGSDINMMRNFDLEFGGELDGATNIHKIVDLGRTFRSVDLIANAAKRFVLKNPNQLDKQVIPAGVSDQPAIRIVSHFKHDADEKLHQTLENLSDQAEQSGRMSVLLLGRYRYLAPKNLPTLRRKFPNLEINFKTIHSSKGLEADHVIMLGVYRGRTGFPSEIVDDPLLNLVSPDEEFFENAEERRVMYVALTRARQSVTLMSSSTKQSAFVAEMLKEPEYLVADHTGPTHPKHICGECGGNLLAFHKKNGGMWYRCEHEKLCGNTMNSCGVCGLDIPKIKQNSNLLRCSCGEEYQACPSLDCCDGWLVERNSRFGQFLGCAKYPKCSGKLQL